MYPQIDFIIFGNQYVVASYSLFAFLGATVGIITALPLLKREGISIKNSMLMLSISAVVFFIGARLLNFLVNPKAYENNLHIYSIRMAGFSVYGGIFGVFCTVFVYSKIIKKKIEVILDALVIPTGLAFILARIGCFFNGCCGGKTTNSFLGMVFPANASEQEVLSKIIPMLGKIEVAVFPTQLFEAGLALLGLIPIFWLYLIKKRNRNAGTYFLLYAVWFSGMRLIVLPFRDLPYSLIVTNIIYPSLYIAIVIIGIILLRIKVRKM